MTTIREFCDDFALAFRQFSRIALASGVEPDDLERFKAKTEVNFRCLASIIRDGLARREGIDRATTAAKN